MAMFDSNMNSGSAPLNTGVSSSASTSMGSGGLPSQSPFSRLVDAVGANNIPGLPGSSSSGSGSNPFASNDSINGAGGQFFGGGAGGAAGNESPFDGIRTKIDKYVSNISGGGSNPMGGGSSFGGGSSTDGSSNPMGGGSSFGGGSSTDGSSNPMGGGSSFGGGSSTGGSDNPFGAVSGGTNALGFQIRVAIDSMVNANTGAMAGGSTSSGENTSSQLSDYVTNLVQNYVSTSGTSGSNSFTSGM